MNLIGQCVISGNVSDLTPFMVHTCVWSGEVGTIEIWEQLCSLGHFFFKSVYISGSAGQCKSIYLYIYSGSCKVRRTAEIAFGDPTDEEYVDLKNYEVNPHRKEYGWTSNNSVGTIFWMNYYFLCISAFFNCMFDAHGHLFILFGSKLIMGIVLWSYFPEHIQTNARLGLRYPGHGLFQNRRTRHQEWRTRIRMAWERSAIQPHDRSAGALVKFYSSHA